MKIQHQILQTAYQSKKGFIHHYQKLVKEVMIPYQYNVMCDNIEGVEKSHVIGNFIEAGKVLRGEKETGEFYGMVFQDSDAAKWLEAVGYILAVYPDESLEKQADYLIDLIAKAQDETGYLNTYFTIKDREKRWKNLLEGHELYCAGHMMEAACAYYEATGKDKLLRVMEKNIVHIYKRFITEEQEGYPGHPEIELALMKMYHTTQNEYCLKLAKHFIDKRGEDPHFYEKEAKARDWTIWGCNPSDLDYMQSSKPVRKQEKATGHAVRAVYLYTGMADLAGQIEDRPLFEACQRLWDSIVEKRMYLTGGIGSTALGEAFTVDYDLPNDTAYAETCASVGLMFFASRMLELVVDRKYADVMESAFYNTVLAGVALDGKRFFYVNPLEVIPGISSVAVTHRHVLTKRPEWYTCACCPPNVARLIASFGKYAYGENKHIAFCHLFADGHINFENGLELVCETDYPYDFNITYKVLSGSKILAIRIPSWSKNYTVTVNDAIKEHALNRGYIYLDVKTGDIVKVILDSKPYRVYASPKVPKLIGQVAICRGPLVYCFEGIDNNEDVISYAIKRHGSLNLVKSNEQTLGGLMAIEVEAIRYKNIETLYTDLPLEEYLVKQWQYLIIHGVIGESARCVFG